MFQQVLNKRLLIFFFYISSSERITFSTSKYFFLYTFVNNFPHSASPRKTELKILFETNIKRTAENHFIGKSKFEI